MTEPENPGKNRRRATRAVLGSLATGAVLGTAAGLTPVVAAEALPPVHQQFEEAFTPGAVSLTGKDEPGSIVVYAS